MKKIHKVRASLMRLSVSVLISVVSTVTLFCRNDVKPITADTEKTANTIEDVIITTVSIATTTMLVTTTTTTTTVMLTTSATIANTEPLTTQATTITTTITQPDNEPTERLETIIDNADIILLAQLINKEASKTWEGRIAVADVVVNRMNSGYWGDTISDVIYARGQFTTAKSLGYYTEEDYQAAEYVLTNGSTNTSLFYFTGGYADGLNKFSDQNHNYICSY